MKNIKNYQGISQFGKAYEYMLKNDLHAEGSVDRVLFDYMIRLCEETSEYLYASYTDMNINYKEGSRPIIEKYVKDVTLGCNTVEDKISNIIKFCSSITNKSNFDDLDSLLFGGTEEEIIERGTQWCTGISRVACVMFQVANIPARMIYTYNTAQPYTAHVVNEVYRNGQWGIVDASRDIIFSNIEGKSISAWEMKKSIDSGNNNDESLFSYKSIALCNYYVNDIEKYNYNLSHMNEYFKSVLNMFINGCPDDIKWLYGEDML